jgi:hypothetical protein
VYDLLSQLRDLSRLAHFQPSGLILHAVAQDPGNWHTALQCGLNRDIVPSSVQTLRLELGFRNTDLASWRSDAEVLVPLEFKDREGNCFLQRRCSWHSSSEVSESTGLKDITTKVSLLFERRALPADEVKPGEPQIHRTSNWKMPAHLNFV